LNLFADWVAWQSLFKLLPTKRQQEQATIVRSLVHGLELAQVLIVTPLHTAARNGIWKTACWSILSPVDDIYEYFGSKVAMYFAWMNFYTTWLIVPGELRSEAKRLQGPSQSHFRSSALRLVDRDDRTGDMVSPDILPARRER
jgi:hypothetical protein